MASLVSSFLHHSANKIDDFSTNKNKKNKRPQQQQQQSYGQLHQATLSTPIFPTSAGGGFYQQQASQSTEWLSPPPYYDPTTASMMTPPSPSPPIMTPSSSWTTTTSIQKEDPTLTIMDRRSISQGMKLVSIAADEYDEGNEAVALDIYLTGLDKILMALPNKTDTKTKLALREKLLSVEERVGILTLAHHRNDTTTTTAPAPIQEEPTPSLAASLVDAMILQKITHTWQSITNATTTKDALSVPSTTTTTTTNTAYRHPYQTPSTHPSSSDSVTIEKFKQLSHAVIQASVALAILIKQSPIPALLGFCFQYLVMIMVWVDAQYGVRRRAHAFGLSGLKVVLETNEQYRLHEFIIELLFMVITASLKAVVAYRETPRSSPFPPVIIDDQQQQQQQQPMMVLEEDEQVPKVESSSSHWLWSVVPSRRS